MAENKLHAIQALGQSIWIDNLTRESIEAGGLRALIDDDGLTGVTSNPTIFEKAMGDSSRYDGSLTRALDERQDARGLFFTLAFEDIRAAAELLYPAFDRTAGKDGFVSFELPPELAFDADGSIESAQRFRKEIDRPNVLIKVPGTAEGVQAFEELTAAGESINVTLLFAVERYEEIAEAYLRGLERRADRGEPIDGIASVASFFVSRVDRKIDAALEECERAELSGGAGIANAKIAYASFQRLFSGPRWDALAERGAKKQRPLWASTSTKNPDYPDTLYVDELIGPETVNTMPDATIADARDHATPERTIDRDVDAAREHMDLVREVGVDVDDIVCRQLVAEGVDAFATSFDSLIETIERKAAALHDRAPSGASS